MKSIKIDIKTVSLKEKEYNVTNASMIVPVRNKIDEGTRLSIVQPENTTGKLSLIVNKDEVYLIGQSFEFEISPSIAVQSGFDHDGKFLAILTDINQVCEVGMPLGGLFVKFKPEFPNVRFVTYELKIEKWR